MPNSLKHKLDSCQLLDQHRLRKAVARLERQQHGGQVSAGALSAIEKDIEKAIEKSLQACERRHLAIPTNISYPDNLPISSRIAEMVDLIGKHQVLVVAGDTGSGKTTQLPKACLQAGLGRRGLIGHTQPRRLAAISVANRIAEELGTRLGAGVGSQVRFHDNTSESTFLKLMTDGILLAEIQQDRFLNKYEAIIIDEAHERSLNIDFLLGFLKQLLRKRSDLKLIITSATIDVEKFSAHFNDAPIVSVSGRAYPVETRYLPLLKTADEPADDDVQIAGIIDVVVDIARVDKQQSRPSGDVLVFLSSEREIRETALKLRKQKIPDTEVLPLYGRLRYSEQLKIFKPHRGRRIVLATNVAETSITVPGINYVIDTGFARISRYSLQKKVQRLPIERISQASANQRQGRCGRVADGICIRLYSEEDFNSRPLFTDPEITRTNLASIILRMRFLKLGEVETFPFLEPPEQKAINEGSKLLIELNALTHRRELTACGRQMAVLPVDPKYARMIVVAHSQSCLREILIIVSALSIQDPREISAENRQQALQKLSEFTHEDSDFLGFVKLWDYYEEKRQLCSQGQLKKYCKSHFLSYMRMREWREVHRQLLLSCQHLGLSLNREEADYSSVHKSIISGSLNQIASKLEGRYYQGNRNKKFTLFASSVLSSAAASWIVSGNLIETNQTFATMAAKIKPQWIEEMALHLVKRDYFEPHWSKKRQEVMAYEKVHLYGLVIIEKSLVRYSDIDPAVSRELFIEEGVIGEQLNSSFDFYRKNTAFMAVLSRQEEKIRRPNFIVSEREVREFYQQRIPERICSSRELASWLKKEGRKAEELLTMTEANLVKSQSALAVMHAFPDVVSIQRNKLSIDYVFKPGTRQDGASLEVPASLLAQLAQADIDWAVPGIIREKSIALLKGLPKSLRKNFIPVSDFVDQVLAQMSSTDGDHIDSLIAQIRNLKKIRIDKAQFLQVAMPDHLQIKIRVLDENGSEVAYGDSLRKLREELGGQEANSARQQSSPSFTHELEAQGLTDWSFADLPASIEIGDELTLIRYPALIDEGESVRISLLADRAMAVEANRSGLIRLLMLRSVQQRNVLRKKFKRLADKLALMLPNQLRGMVDDAMVMSYRAAFEVDDNVPRNKDEFEQVLLRGKSRVLGAADKIESLLYSVLEQRFTLLRQVQRLAGGELGYVKFDVEKQLDRLIHENFLSETGLLWFTEYPRYLKAIEARLSKAPHMGDKDAPNTELLDSYWCKFTALQDQPSSPSEQDLMNLRWMLEEFRVSLFAQNLGTRMVVSAKRLDKNFENLLSM